MQEEKNIIFSKNWSKKDEFKAIDMMCEWIQNDKLKQQIKMCFYWAVPKAWKYLTLHTAFLVISIILPASIPVIIAYNKSIPCWEALITIVSFLATILAATTVSLKFKSLWKMFRRSVEQLKCECYQYAISTGKYEKLSDKEDANQSSPKDRELCKRVVEIYNNTLHNWEDTYSSPDKPCSNANHILKATGQENPEDVCPDDSAFSSAGTSETD